MPKKIVIEKPRIEHVGEKTRLCATIRLPKRTVDFFYEVDRKFEKYLVPERADAFLLMVLEHGMADACNIECEAPVSRQLLYQLNNYFIPILSKHRKLYHPIEVLAEAEDEVCSKDKAGGTGFSGGVDSFYSVLSCLANNYERMELTHVIFANNGSLSPKFNYGQSVSFYETKLAEFRKPAKDLGLELIGINTNMLELYSDLKDTQAINAGAVKTLSMVYSLKKLFGFYWFSNGYDFSDFRFSDTDDAYYDLFTLDLLSIDGLKIYSAGSELPKRTDKLAYIANNKIVQNHLLVCSHGNCGRCAKCLRTLGDLYVLGELRDGSKWEKVFDVKYYKEHFIRQMTRYLANKKERSMGFTKEIIEKGKETGYKVPIRCIIFAAILRPVLWLKHRVEARL